MSADKSLTEAMRELEAKIDNYLSDHPARMEDEHLWLLSESRDMIRALINRHE